MNRITGSTMNTHQHTTERRPCSIQDLSTELLLMIMEYLPYSSDFDFAITCRRSANLSHDLLKRHQNAYTKYRVSSNLGPATVPFLLRSAFGDSDPLPAWHVRSFEAWTDRSHWRHWVTTILDRDEEYRRGPVTPFQNDDEVMASSQYRIHAHTFKRYMRDLFGENGLEVFGHELSRSRKDVWRDMLEVGSDSILKALLFAKCPRLQDLKFVATAKAVRWTCLMVLTRLIRVCVHVSDNANPREDCSAQDTSTDQEAALWPVGFVNIRSVAVGVRSGTFLDDSGYTTNSLWLMHLSRLPNLDSLYINGLRNYPILPGEPLEKLIPAGSSSVKHIFLDNPDRLEDAAENAIWAAPKQLLTASIRYENTDHRTTASTAFSKLLRSRGTSLQSTMWYGPEDFDTRVLSGRQFQPISSYRTFERADIDNLRRTTTIKSVSFYMQDIMKMAINSLDVDELEFVTGLFPESMETLVLVGTLDLTEESSLESLAEWLDLALAKIITCGRYPNLKALYLEGVEKRRLSQKPRFKPWFQKVIAAGGGAGLDVHTLTNRAPLQHSIGIFEVPDKYDLVTGPHKGIRSSDQVFNPYLGHRVSLGCQRCGSCEDCLREYRDFVWETRA